MNGRPCTGWVDSLSIDQKRSSCFGSSPSSAAGQTLPPSEVRSTWSAFPSPALFFCSRYVGSWRARLERVDLPCTPPQQAVASPSLATARRGVLPAGSADFDVGAACRGQAVSWHSAPLLAPDGNIHVASKDVKPYTWWRIPLLADDLDNIR